MAICPCEAETIVSCERIIGVSTVICHGYSSGIEAYRRYYVRIRVTTWAVADGYHGWHRIWI